MSANRLIMQWFLKLFFLFLPQAGDTAIYNAVEHDMLDSLVALVAFGGDVNITEKVWVYFKSNVLVNMCT